MRRIIAFTLLTAILIIAATARGEEGAEFVLSFNDGDVLVNPSGEMITERGKYASISPVVENGEGATLYSAYGALSDPVDIIDGTGKIVNSGVYDSVYNMGDGVVYLIKDDLTGVADSDMNEIIPCEYTQIVYNGVDGFLALSSDPYDERPDGVYYVGMDKSETATGVKVYFGLGTFFEGLMPVVDASNNRMGYLDEHGNWAIPSQYEFAGEFKNGVAEAALVAGSGFIDKSGNWLVTPKYWQVSMSGAHGKLILAQEDNSSILLLDSKTFLPSRTFTGEDIYFSSYYDVDMAVVYMDDCTLLVGSDGQDVMECGLDAEFDAWAEMNGRFILRQGDWGEKCVWLCDMDGKKLTDAYQDIWYVGGDDSQPLFACASFDVIDSVDVENAWHDRSAAGGSYTIDVVDADANCVIKGLKYDSLRYGAKDTLVFSTDETTGAIDLSGKVICEFAMT